MPSKNEASGFRRHALVPDFHNGGIVRTDGNASNSEPGDRPSESVAHE